MNWFRNKNNFYFIVIAVLIIVILLQKCGGGNDGQVIVKQNDTIRTVDTSYVTIAKEILTYVPKWQIKIKYIHDTTKVIDTSFVLNDYYSTYFYKDSLKTNELRLYVEDSISQNKITSRKLNYFINLPIVTVNNTVIKNKTEFYAGMGLIGNKIGINYFGPEMIIRTKNKNAYGLGVGIDGNLQPNISLRIYWKIGKK